MAEMANALLVKVRPQLYCIQLQYGAGKAASFFLYFAYSNPLKKFFFMETLLYLIWSPLCLIFGI